MDGRGSDCLTQAGIAVLNEEFSVKKLAVLIKISAAENYLSTSRYKWLFRHS
jgi:hypothetical protein